jgi:alginate O-acetyltransferase complex protein AlgJ
MPLLRDPLMQRACIGLFLLLMVLPGIGQVAGIGCDVKTFEMREPHVLPGWPLTAADWAAWPGLFEAWLKDHFGFRNQLVLANNAIRVRLLKTSTSPSVVLGRHGWLFYSGERSIDQARGLDRFTPEELDRWIDVMEARQRWLVERGIPMLVVAVPNKERVYQEELPAWIGQSRGESRLDQLARRLRERNSRLDFMDLTPGLLAAKATRQVFLKNDTHWTIEGAFTVAYPAICGWIRATFPAFVPLTEADMERAWYVRPGSDLDLARMLGLAEISHEGEWRYTLAGPARFTSNTRTAIAGVDVDVLRADRPGTPKVLWYRDSFTISLYPQLAETLGEAVIVEHRGLRFDRPLVEACRPDVVVYQFVERFLTVPMPAE